MCKLSKILIGGLVTVFVFGLKAQEPMAEENPAQVEEVVLEQGPGDLTQETSSSSEVTPQEGALQDSGVEQQQAPQEEKPLEQAPAQVQASVDTKELSPQAPEPQVRKVNEQEEALVGIDTINVDEPAGNWLYKRLYWERAEDKYQKIKDLMTTIFDARTKFFNQRVEMDKKIFDPLYNAANFSRGELSSVLKELLQDLDAQKDAQKGVSEEGRILFAKIEANKGRLEEIKKEIEFVGKIDSAVDEAINTLISLINQARSFETQAWGDFKAISRELSDKKARDLFYRIDTYWKNVKDIQVYVTTKLSEHMNYLSRTAQQHADAIQGMLKELADQGFVLKDQVAALEKAKKPLADEEQFDAVKPVKTKSVGFFAGIQTFFGWMAKPFVAIAKALWHTISIPFSYFFGGKKPMKEETSSLGAPEVALEGETQQKEALPKAP